MSTNRKPLEFKAAKTRFRPRERRQNDFLFYLVDGQSIEQVCNLRGVTRAAYEKWRDRHKGFNEAVEAARESHRRDVLCSFHLADAYARLLLDATERDESLTNSSPGHCGTSPNLSRTPRLEPEMLTWLRFAKRSSTPQVGARFHSGTPALTAPRTRKRVRSVRFGCTHSVPPEPGMASFRKTTGIPQIPTRSWSPPLHPPAPSYNLRKPARV